jgi:hypothetical protein
LHLACGGVSDFQGYVTLDVQSSVQDKYSCPLGSFHGSYPLCNLSSIVKCTVQGTCLLLDPGLPPLRHATTAVSLGLNLFHYKGLFPFGSWDAEFFVPCVFARKPVKLTCQKMSVEELQEILDIPERRMRP